MTTNVNQLPTPVPSRLMDSAAYVAAFNALIAALPGLVNDINGIIPSIDAAILSGGTANAASLNATAAANTAQSAAGATAWVSGTTYALNKVAISQSNFQCYRRIVAGAGTVDPANDLVNWVLLYGNDANGAFLPYAMPALDVDLTKGNYYTLTVNGAVNLTISNCPTPGYSFTLEVTLTSGSIGLPASVKYPGDAVPTLSAGKTHMFMFVTSNGGARWRVTVAGNYTT